jgi:hypothetical protein
MIAAFAIHIPIARFGNDREPWIDSFNRKSNWQTPAMKTVEEVQLQIVRHLCSLTDSRNHNEEFFGDFQFIQRFDQILS